MATNQVFLPGKSLRLAITSGSGVSSGDFGVEGSLPYVALTDGDSDGNVTVAIDGVFDLTIQADEALSVGSPVYFASGSSVLVSGSSSNTFFGYALEALASGSAVKNVKVGW